VNVLGQDRLCELSTNTVLRAQQSYLHGGWAAVSVKHGHRPKGAGGLLSAEEEKKVQWLIQDRTPDQLKLSYALWTRQAVNELIDVRFGIRIQIRTMGKYMKRWCFTP
jgi:transposase